MTMLKLILVLLVLQMAHGSCPPGFTLVRNGQCRGLSETAAQLEFNKSYDHIVQKCAEIDGLPIIIHDEEDEKYWESVKDKNGNPPHLVWPIGLTCNVTSKLWVWADGSPVDYRPAEYGDALDEDCSNLQDCSWAMYKDWRIICQDLMDGPASIYCTTQLQPPVPSDECDRFNEDEDVCYEIGEEASSWQDAQMSCRSVGAYLASIQSSQENTFIRRMAVSNGAVDGVYLGARISGIQDKYDWVDGSPWDYQNFAPGYPKGNGECLAMDTSTTAGQWTNKDCSTKLPVGCIRYETRLHTVDYVCSTGPWKEREVITSPGYPFEAWMPCEFLLSVVAGKRARVEIITLEANSCCDRLTLYDAFADGKVIANITGEVSNATYTSSSNHMRVSWEPKGGLNVKGLAMIFYGV